jgi:hypothetical protein
LSSPLGLGQDGRQSIFIWFHDTYSFFLNAG